MKKFVSLALPAAMSLMFVAPALAQDMTKAPDGKMYPPAWPRPGSTTLVENDRVAAYNVVYPKDKPTPMHRHRFPVAGLDLNTATLRVTSLDGRPMSLHTVIRNNMWFLKEGTWHQEMSTTNPGRHTVVIDIKHKSIPAAKNTTKFPDDKFADGAKVVDNDTVNIWNVGWGENAPAYTAFDSRDIVLAFTDGGDLNIATDGGAPKVQSVKEGEAIFLPGGHTRAISSTKGTIHGMLVEVK